MERADKNLRTASPHPSRSLPIAFAALVAVCLATSLPAQMLKARGSGMDLRLVRTAGQHRIVLPDGGTVTLPLSAVASVGDFRLVGGDWWVAAVDRRREDSALVVLEGRADKISSLPVPAVGLDQAVREPRLLVACERLDGMLWLEGDAGDRMTVRAARWDGGAWESPATVSPAGPGTQIALTATVLADGSWLAAWAAFDGRDDEILWSRLSGGRWSSPRPVAADNAVPDITPSLIATADGALLAWSRYDGHDYRVHLARFDASGWAEPAMIGTKGSAFPVFSDDRSPILIYRQAVPDAWRVAELDARGKVLRQAEAAASDQQAPVVAGVSEDGVVLEWAESSATIRWLGQ
ncbi:MAG: hypothetical protein V3T72_16865 [Thermoanaerobaculia bacterium]